MKQTLWDRLEDEELAEAGFYCNEGLGLYNSDGNYKIDDFIEEFLFNNGATRVRTAITESKGYECYVVSVAWLDSCGLHLHTLAID